MSKARGRTLADRRFRFTSEDRWGYFFIFVAMVVFVTFTLYPVVSAVRTSFLKYKPFGGIHRAEELYRHLQKRALL